MPKRVDPAIVGGLVLILTGALYLLQTIGLLDNVGDVFWGAIFLSAGALFLFAYFTGSWWAAIPGCTLAGLGVLILLPDSLEKFGGAVFLGSIALAFWMVYLTAPRERWWALIPAGVLTVLAVVTFLPDLVGGHASGSIFFLGLALTFVLVALLAGHKWAWYPAAVLAAIGLISLLALENLSNYIWAGALILAGGFFIFRAMRRSA
ncbi:MAG: hypothetical protein HY867_14395 [Chloroflexi bacterium]|nr:hypothetical protein [Chloroflexota bacterium]